MKRDTKKKSGKCINWLLSDRIKLGRRSQAIITGCLQISKLDNGGVLGLTISTWTADRPFQTPTCLITAHYLCGYIIGYLYLARQSKLMLAILLYKSEQFFCFFLCRALKSLLEDVGIEVTGGQTVPYTTRRLSKFFFMVLLNVNINVRILIIILKNSMRFKVYFLINDTICIE